MKTFLAAASLAFMSQFAFAECFSHLGCSYYEADAIQHASCIRQSALRIQLGGKLLLQDGQVLLAGGMESGGRKTVMTNRAFLYDPQKKVLCEIAPMISERNQGYSPVQIADGKVLVAGGWTNYDAIPDAELFDPASGSWSKAGPLPVKLAYYEIELMSDGNPIISKGSIPLKRGKEFKQNLESFIFDVQSKTFSIAK